MRTPTIFPVGWALASPSPLPVGDHAAVQTVPVKKSKSVVVQRKKRRAGKHYSKATLSAFQPLAAHSGHAAAVRPVASMGLKPRPTAPLPSLSAPFFIAPVAQGVLAADEQPFVLTEVGSLQPSAVLVEDSDVLGQESVSVIDRFSDRPKARPLAKGPWRLRMRDQGLRATVQIPIYAH